MKKQWSLNIHLFLTKLAFICFLISCKKDNISDSQLKKNHFAVESLKSKNHLQLKEHTKLKGVLWDINDMWFMQCNNEYVHVQGKILYTFNSIMINNMLHINYQFHYQNVHGVGQTSGAKYTLTGHATEQQNLYYDPANGYVPKTFNITNKIITTTPGSNNSITTITYHVIRNSKGDLVVNKVNFNINICR